MYWPASALATMIVAALVLAGAALASIGDDASSPAAAVHEPGGWSISTSPFSTADAGSVSGASLVSAQPDIMATPQRDLRTGIIWLGVGIGFAALGAALSFEEPDSLLPLLGVAAFPVFIGLAFVILSVINKRKA